jgi:hypothetical protein
VGCLVDINTMVGVLGKVWTIKRIIPRNHSGMMEMDTWDKTRQNSHPRNIFATSSKILTLMDLVHGNISYEDMINRRRE